MAYVQLNILPRIWQEFFARSLGFFSRQLYRASPFFMNSAALLSLLRRNARTHVEDLARELDVTEEAVTAEITRLEQEGLILGYQAILDAQRIDGDMVTAIIEVRITPERWGGFDRLAARIARFDQVQSCYLMSGAYDLLVVVEGRTLHDVSGFISEKLSTIKGVISTATHFRLKAYKENGVALHREGPSQRLAVAP
jgi:DNA-binding Lrp family transcriptional regulator